MIDGCFFVFEQDAYDIKAGFEVDVVALDIGIGCTDKEALFVAVH